MIFNITCPCYFGGDKMGNLIVKDNALIEASHKLSESEQRLVLLAILKGREFCDSIGVCQHSCHPYLNQATETSLALTRLDRRTGLRAVGSTGEQFLTALPFQRAGFTCFAITSTDSRLARISPSLSV